MRTMNLSVSTKLFLLVSAMAFSSCEKWEVEGSPNNPSIPTTQVVTEPFFAKVDGTEFVESNVVASLSAWSQTLSVEASRNGGEEFVRLKMNASISAGTYDFDDPDVGLMAAYYYDGNSIYGAPSGTGSLTIVSNIEPQSGIPGEIKGTFSFSASPYSFSSDTDSYTISEGQFIVNYQQMMVEDYK